MGVAGVVGDRCRRHQIGIAADVHERRNERFLARRPKVAVERDPFGTHPGEPRSIDEHELESLRERRWCDRRRLPEQRVERRLRNRRGEPLADCLVRDQPVDELPPRALPPMLRDIHADAT